MNNDEVKKEEDYRFVKEVIKKKTIRPRDVLIRLACVAGAAILFGIIAAFVFVRFLPVVQGQEETMKPIDFEEDHPEVTSEPTPEPTKRPTPTPEKPQSNVPPASDSDVQTTQENPLSGDSAMNEASGISQESENNSQKEENAVLGAYSEMYDEMQSIAAEAMRSIVTVAGITSNEDWFSIQSDYSKQSSGLIVADNGQELYILTEYKVVDTVERVVVTFCDDTIVDGRYQMHDPNTGLTILKVSRDALEEDTLESLAIAKLGNSYHVSQGDAVIALGSPMGYNNSVVYGQITSVANTVSTYDKQYNLFTTNILGNSLGSGVLINLEGEVVSVIAQRFADIQHENVVMGLPISQLKSLIEILSNGGSFPYLGIIGETVTTEMMNQTGMPKGVYITSMNGDSPALYAGVRHGDIIVKYNEEAIETVSQYADQLFRTGADVTVTLTIMRKSTEGYREFEYEVVTGNW